MTTNQERTDIMKFKRYMAMVTALCVCAAFAGCGNSSSESSSIAESSISVTESVSESSTPESTADRKAENTQTEVNEAVTDLSRIDMTKWQYNADDEVYYQVGM